MCKDINEKNQNEIYFISIKGELHETTYEIYKVFKGMKRREKYLQERSKINEISFDFLSEMEYPIELELFNKPKQVEEEIITKCLIEQMLSIIPLLNESEKWIIEQLFFMGKSEVEVSKESGMARTTIQSRKYTVLKKMRKLMEETH